MRVKVKGNEVCVCWMYTKTITDSGGLFYAQYSFGVVQCATCVFILAVFSFCELCIHMSYVSKCIRWLCIKFVMCVCVIYRIKCASKSGQNDRTFLRIGVRVIEKTKITYPFFVENHTCRSGGIESIIQYMGYKTWFAPYIKYIRGCLTFLLGKRVRQTEKSIV